VLDLWRRYLLPGFVFQGVTIGGGYATGRELVEFFGPPGPAGGLLGMLVAAMVFSAVLAVSFELVRLTRAFDYKSFFTLLLGRGWVLFEVAYVLLLLVILSVLGAAAGTLALMAVIGLIVARGSGWVEKSTAAVALSLYAIYLALIAWTFTAFGDRVAAGLAAPVGGGWFGAGVTYAGYNLSCAAAVFFCVRHARSRRDALTAGALAGPITMLPGVLLFASLMAFHPEIGAAAVPSAYVLAQLQAPAFALVFQLVVFGALVSTGAPMLHAINERAAAAFAARGRAMPQALRPALSLSTMAVAIFAASAVGLVGLIARGYGWLTWAFIVLQVIPVLTIGIWKIRALGAAAPPPAAAGASAS
jgi:uncharacterized membrane protein YkvI